MNSSIRIIVWSTALNTNRHEIIKLLPFMALKIYILISEPRVQYHRIKLLDEKHAELGTIFREQRKKVSPNFWQYKINKNKSALALIGRNYTGSLSEAFWWVRWLLSMFYLHFLMFTCIEWSSLARCDLALSRRRATAPGSQLPLNS